MRRGSSTLAGRRLTRDGVLVITAARFRTQARNREDARERLSELIREAAIVPKVRRATRPPRASKAKRADDKQRRGRVKALRRSGLARGTEVRAGWQTRARGLLRQWHARWMASLRPQYKHRQEAGASAAEVSALDPPHKAERVCLRGKGARSFPLLHGCPQRVASSVNGCVTNSASMPASTRGHQRHTELAQGWSLCDSDNHHRDAAVYHGYG